jgi:hypothetical protein
MSSTYLEKTNDRIDVIDDRIETLLDYRDASISRYPGNPVFVFANKHDQSNYIAKGLDGEYITVKDNLDPDCDILLPEAFKLSMVSLATKAMPPSYSAMNIEEFTQNRVHALNDERNSLIKTLMISPQIEMIAQIVGLNANDHTLNAILLGNFEQFAVSVDKGLATPKHMQAISLAVNDPHLEASRDNIRYMSDYAGKFGLERDKGFQQGLGV